VQLRVLLADMWSEAEAGEYLDSHGAVQVRIDHLVAYICVLAHLRLGDALVSLACQGC
jgi:hypothetical protein